MQASTKPRKIRSTIDNLPEAVRIQVLDMCLDGASLGAIAKVAGCSRQAVCEWRQRNVKPAMETARALQKLQSNQQVEPRPDDANAVRASTIVKAAETVSLTRDIVKSSPVRDRLEKLWQRIDTSLDRAETAVRTVTDKASGEQVVVGEDLGVMAPLLNQAHKNVEIFGKLTGELKDQSDTQVAIQIVYPQQVIAMRAAGTDGVPTVNIGIVQR